MEQVQVEYWEMDIKKVNGLNSLNEEGSKWAIMDVLLESAVVLFGQSKYPKIRWFWTIFCHKTRVFSLQKVPKKTVLSTMVTIYI